MHDKILDPLTEHQHLSGGWMRLYGVLTPFLTRFWHGWRFGIFLYRSSISTSSCRITISDIRVQSPSIFFHLTAVSTRVQTLWSTVDDVPWYDDHTKRIKSNQTGTRNSPILPPILRSLDCIIQLKTRISRCVPRLITPSTAWLPVPQWSSACSWVELIAAPSPHSNRWNN